MNVRHSMAILGMLAIMASTQRTGASVFTKGHVDRARRNRRNRIARLSRRRNRRS